MSTCTLILQKHNLIHMLSLNKRHKCQQTKLDSLELLENFKHNNDNRTILKSHIEPRRSPIDDTVITKIAIQYTVHFLRNFIINKISCIHFCINN